MIETKAILTIVAADDAEADAVYTSIWAVLTADGLSATWPATPIVNIAEVERTYRPHTDIEERARR